MASAADSSGGGDGGAAPSEEAPPAAPTQAPPPPPPLLLCLKGHPGCGKSTLARALAAALRCPLVDKDDARDVLWPLEGAAGGAPSAGPAADAAPPAADLNAACYAIALRVAATQLGLGMSVVFDSPLAHARVYAAAAAVAVAAGAVPVVLEVFASDEPAWRARLEARGAADAGTERAHRPATWAALGALLQRYDGCWRWPEAAGAGPAVPHFLRVDTAPPGGSGGEGGGEAPLREVLRFLRGRGLL